ncbi:MAG: lysophospholipase [Anaerolineae bacterium]|nr:lysophospholipase [Anaerolineae bacterium]
MIHEESTVTAPGNMNLYYQIWRPDAPPRATLVITHGLGEHSGRYMNVVNHLVPKGYVVYALDHLGHGRSPGQRGYIKSWADFREGVRALVQLAQVQEAARPFFLFGHSMGGCITLDYVLHYPDGLTAVVASAPAIGQLTLSPARTFLARLSARIKPDMSMDSGLDTTAISRDTAVVEAYRADPLVHDKGSPGAAVAFVDTAAWVMAHAADFQPPLLLIHGDADRLVRVEESQKFFAQVKQPDKKLIIYPGGHHESHNDLHKEQMLADVESWLEAHM